MDHKQSFSSPLREVIIFHYMHSKVICESALKYWKASCLYSKVKEVLYKHTVCAKLLHFCKLAGCLISQGQIQHHTQASFRPFPQAQFIIWNANFTKQHNTRLFPLTKTTPKGPCDQESLDPAGFLGSCQDPLYAFPWISQDWLVPGLLHHPSPTHRDSLRCMPPVCYLLLFLFFLFFFFFLLNLVFSQITSIDIFSLPENTDKNFSIPIIIFCCSAHGSLSSNRGLAKTIYSTGTWCTILQFCSTKILSFICFIGLLVSK